MNKHISPVLLCIVALLLTLLFSGCRQNPQPNIDEIYREFQENQGKFQQIADYFSSVKYTAIYIDSGDKFFWADFHQYPFDEMEAEVYNEINYLFDEKGYLSISKNNIQLGVEFRMWTDYRSIDCGVIYAVRNDAEPQPQFVVELVPLPEEGWYYYVSDYNKWRSQQTGNSKGDGSVWP